MNDLDLCLDVVSRSCHPLCYIRRWISRKPLELEVWLQRTTNKNGIWGIKWSRDRWRHVTPKVRWAVRSAILATAWLLVYFYWRSRAHHTIYITGYSLVRVQTDEHTNISVITAVWDWKHWNSVAHFRYRGSIEYRNTWDGIVIVAPISGIAQH